MIKIVIATPADYDTIRKLAYEIWPDAYGHILSKNQLDFMLDNFYSIESIAKSIQNNQPFLLAVDDDSCLGFISYEHLYKGKAVTRIHKIYILTETQGKGIGKLLISEVESLAKISGSKALSLNVNRFNNAQFFYKKIGFKITGEEDIDIGRGYLMEDFMMEKSLD